jgi:hypothetical protein
MNKDIEVAVARTIEEAKSKAREMLKAKGPKTGQNHQNQP